MSEFRMARVRNLLRSEISAMILKREIKDPRIDAYLSVSNVEVSKDIAHAKVFISSYENRKKLNTAVSALNNAAGYVQFLLGKKMKTRNTPKLVFIADDSISEGDKMNLKLKELHIE